MMSLNNNAGAQAIFYLCATSTTIALLVTLGSVAIVAGAVSEVPPSTTKPSTVAAWLPKQGVNASPNMHNSTEMQANATNEEKSNNLNHFQKNNHNDSIMVLSPSLSTPSRDWNSGNQHPNNEQEQQQQHSDQHSFEMENSRKYLHLDEHNFVATTPKIQTTKLPNRYEQGLEDYEEAVARVDKIKEEQKKQQAYGMDGLESVLSLIETAGNVWNKVSTEFEQKQSTITDKSNDRPTNDFDSNNDDDDDDKKSEAGSTDVAEGRYIKGDPLKGYYDFIITEGSYKFWAGFQLFTAGLMIYSTFAAIYYSKVNPVVGDYDYTSYLGGGRSMADDPEPLSSTSTPWSELSNSYLFETAAHGFQFVLDAIEKIPKT